MFEPARNINANTKNGTMAEYGDDSQVWVEFEVEAVLDQFKHDESGIPVYRDVEMVTIITPGNNKSTYKTEWSRLPTVDKMRFKKKYEDWKAGREAKHEGLPLTEWPVVTKAQALNLNAQKIFTVEQLGNIIDQHIDVLGLGGRDLRDKAKAYLDRVVGSKEITQVFARLKKLEDESAAKDETIKSLNEQLSGKNESTLKLKRA